MLYQIVSLLLEVAAGLLTGIFLLRLLGQGGPQPALILARGPGPPGRDGGDRAICTPREVRDSAT